MFSNSCNFQKLVYEIIAQLIFLKNYRNPRTFHMEKDRQEINFNYFLIMADALNRLTRSINPLEMYHCSLKITNSSETQCSFCLFDRDNKSIGCTNIASKGFDYFYLEMGAEYIVKKYNDAKEVVKAERYRAKAREIVIDDNLDIVSITDNIESGFLKLSQSAFPKSKY